MRIAHLQWVVGDQGGIRTAHVATGCLIILQPCMCLAVGPHRTGLTLGAAGADASSQLHHGLQRHSTPSMDACALHKFSQQTTTIDCIAVGPVYRAGHRKDAPGLVCLAWDLIFGACETGGLHHEPPLHSMHACGVCTWLKSPGRAVSRSSVARLLCVMPAILVD